MPTYVYECAKCGDEFELWQSFSDEPLKKHAGCGGKVTKVLQPVGIVLKGSGFYRTDNRGSSSRAAAKSDSGEKSAKSDSGSSDSGGSTGSSSSSGSGDAKKSETKKSDTTSTSKP